MGFRFNLPQCPVCNSLIEGNGIKCSQCNQIVHNSDNCVNVHKRLCSNRFDSDLKRKMTSPRGLKLQ